jgi:2-methylcitrate dehydratase PrpD
MRLAEFVTATDFSSLPTDVVEISKKMMLNAAGVGLAGSATREGKIIAEYVGQQGSSPACTILGSSTRSSPASAALANGTMVHVLDFDEYVPRRRLHPSNVIFPVVMALGESLALPGSVVVNAFSIGCEVSTKIGAAGDLNELLPTLARYGWHLEGVAGTIGATAAAGKMLGLDQEMMENAFGISVSQAAGAQVNHGTSTKSLHCGHAAMHGIISSSLAQKGFTGARNAIEDAEGFFGCYRRDVEVDEDEFVRNLGSPYDVIDPGVTFKRYPCASAIHASIDAVLELVETHAIKSEQVRNVHVSCPPRVGVDLDLFAHPDTGLQAKFSVNYCVAVALAHGVPRVKHFTDAAVKDPNILSLLDSITVDNSETISVRASRASTVEIELLDGRHFRSTVEYIGGQPPNPITPRELDDKFASCAEGILPGASIGRVISGFQQIDGLTNVVELFSSLGRRS